MFSGSFIEKKLMIFFVCNFYRGGGGKGRGGGGRERIAEVEGRRKEEENAQKKTLNILLAIVLRDHAIYIRKKAIKYVKLFNKMCNITTNTCIFCTHTLPSLMCTPYYPLNFPQFDTCLFFSLASVLPS